MQPSLPFDSEHQTRSPVQVVTCRPGEALGELAAAIRSAKGDDRLAPVTVIVSTNIAGVMARRALGRDGGVLGVDVITIGRVAELIAGPSLAAERRRPVSTPILEVTVADVLTDTPGMFAEVADHPTTITALREAHQELRLAGADGASALAARGRRGAEVVRVSRAVTRRLRDRWYDEADILDRATTLLDDGLPAGLRHLVFHLPQRFDAAGARFIRRASELVPTTIVSARTGDTDADLGAVAAVRAVTGDPAGDDADMADRPATSPDAVAPTVPAGRPARIVTTTDADDEVRIALRTVVDAARGKVSGSPVPFERIGVFWPSHVPYARLVEHHLTVDGIPWNGRGGVAVAERIAPRLLLDLLDVDRRRFRRTDLFDLLADVPARDEHGRRRPTAEWQRLSRAAGISDGADWNRLRAYDESSPWAETAAALSAFVDDLRDRLGPPDHTRTWSEWSEWCHVQLTDWLGPRAEIRLSDPEFRAWEALMSILDRLRSLDHVAASPSRARFRSVLQSELDDVSVREGRIGTGIVTGSLASAPGLDLDVVVVLGATDGILPPPPRPDPLLSEEDRRAAGLVSADERSRQLHHALRSVLDASTTVVTAPRGDLRSTTEHHTSRWLASHDDTKGGPAPIAVEHVASATAGLTGLDEPPSERERRLRDRLRSGVSVDSADPTLVADPVLGRAVRMRAGRESPTLTEYDGDLSGAEVPPLGNRPVSPTQLQMWADCPHAYFVRYLLRVRPVEEVDRELSIRPLESGNLQHQTLDLLHRDVLAGRLPQPTEGWTDEHRAALLAHFEQVCLATERRGRVGRPATWFGERARLQAELVSWLHHDGRRAAEHGAAVVRSEFAFGHADAHLGDAVEEPPVALALADGRRLPVFGSADRIDRWRDGTVVITDHKTGRDHYTKLSADDPTLGGTVFQLPAYAAAAAALVADARTVRAEYSMFDKGGFARRGFTFTDDVWARVSHALTHTVDGIESGWFPRRPERPGWRLYVDCLYCDPDEIGTDDAWSQWTTKRHDPRLAPWFGDPPSTDDAPSEPGSGGSS